MKNITLFFFLLASVVCNSQIVTIPDDGFKALLLAANPDVNIAWNAAGNRIKVDVNNDNQIQVSEALSVYKLSLLNDYPVSSIEGIEAFQNLKNLNSSGNQLVECNVSMLANLETIEVNDNPLTSIDVSGCAALTVLKCVSNQLTTLDVSGLHNLELIWCHNNMLTSINLQGCTALETLLCQENELQALDLTGLSSLNWINARDNQVTTASLSGCGNLVQLWLADNQLSSLNFEGLNSLQSLELTNNLFTSIDLSLLDLGTLAIEGNSLGSIDLSTQVNLGNLNVTATGLATLDVSMCPLLTSLQAPDNMLTELDLSNNSQLDFILLSNNQISYLNIKNGNNEFLYYEWQQSSLEGNPLQYICADEEDLEILGEALGVWGLNPQYNTYCTFTPGGIYNTISGTATFDADVNGCDPGDGFADFAKIKIEDGVSSGIAFAGTAGNYSFYTPEGTFVLTPQLENDWFTITPPSIEVPFSSLGNTSTENFCIAPNGVHSDIDIVIVPLSTARPGIDAGYKIVYQNKGNQILSGTIVFNYQEDVLDVISANPAENSSSQGVLSWDYSNLAPFQAGEIYIVLNVNGPMETPPVNINDLLAFSASVTPVSGDETPGDNSFEISQTVVGSFDPNDITCLEGDSVSPDKIGEYLHYNVNFENTGTAPATFIVVKDVIDTTQFDIASLQLINASHPVMAKITDNKLEFRFDAINLGPQEKGNVTFKIKSLNTLQPNDNVTQQANIFFDYNWPVETNEATTTFEVLSRGDFEIDNSVKIYPNPSNGIVNIKAVSEIRSAELYDVQGRLLQAGNISMLDISGRTAGIYFLKVITEKGMKVEKLVKE